MTEVLSEEDLDKIAERIARKLVRGAIGFEDDRHNYDCTGQVFICRGDSYTCRHPHKCPTSYNPQ